MTEEELIEKYEDLIYKVAKRFYSIDISDLFQAGSIGLIKAYRKFDNQKSDNFINFAYMYIFGEMYELSLNSQNIKLNKDYLKLYKKIEEARSLLFDKLKRYPSNFELSLFLEIDESIINDVCMLTSSVISLDSPIDTNSGNNLSISDCIGNYDDPINKILIDESLECLSDMEKQVITSRYFEDLTQCETAKILNISQVKVSRLEQKGKQKIKEYIAA